MKTVKITMFFNVNDEKGVEELKKLEHHADYILDLDSFPEVKSVYGVTVKEVK